MSPKQFLHEDKDFQQLIVLVSENKGINPVLVEKDYWLMHCLWGLQQAGFNFELKGGTSLSKGFNLIDRFSEDVDIRIEPPAELNMMSGRNHDKPSHIESRKKFYEYIVENLSIPGFSSIQRDTEFDDDKLRNGGIRLNYTSNFERGAVIKPFILLEVGFDEVTPNEAVNISSWIFEYAQKIDPGVADNRALNVKCYNPEYTLVDKLDAIVRKFEKEQSDGKMPKNFIRHYYDISRLLKAERVVKFVGTPEYIAHKRNRFKSKNPLSNQEAFKLSNIETKKRYQAEYDRIKDFFYTAPPSFDDILIEIQKHLSRL